MFLIFLGFYISFNIYTYKFIIIRSYKILIMASDCFSTLNDAVFSTENFKPVAFMENNVELFFNALKNSFTCQKVYTDIDRYSCLLDPLPTDQHTTVRYIITQPSPGGKYEAMKTDILAQSSISGAEKL